MNVVRFKSPCFKDSFGVRTNEIAKSSLSIELFVSDQECRQQKARWKTWGRGPGVRGAGSRGTGFRDVENAGCGKHGVWKTWGVENAGRGKRGVWKTRGLLENTGSTGCGVPGCGKRGVWKTRGVENAGRAKRGVWKTWGLVENAGSGGKHGV